MTKGKGRHMQPGVMIVAVVAVLLFATGMAFGASSDDFEDGVIDSSLWLTGGQTRAYNVDVPGGDYWSYAHSEVVASDGYYQASVKGNGTSPGAMSFGAEAWIRTVYDYNDGRSHTIDFTWEAVVSESYYNHYFIQITDGWISPNGHHAWAWSELEKIPGMTANLLRGNGLVCRALPSGQPRSDWSVTIDPSGIGRLFDGANGTGSLLYEASLDTTPGTPWYLRFMILDADNSGARGDIALNLYSFQSSASGPAPVPEPLTMLSAFLCVGGLVGYVRRHARKGRAGVA